jgi:parallel beta-helix repeat protein
MYPFVLRYAASAFPVWFQEIGMIKVVGVLFSLAVLMVVGCGGGGSPPQPPSITTQPADATVVGGQDATFTVVATGRGLSYQWQRSDDGGATWADIAGATSAGYTFSTMLADDGAQFACIVTNYAGSVTSDAAMLAVNMAVPAVTSQPADATVVEGQDATFTVEATGGALSYQWQKDGVDVTGGTGAASDTYTTPATLLVDDGAQFTCVITNTQGNVTSNAATLTVNMAPPTITTQPADVTVVEGQDATFTVVAAGSGTLAYQWQKDGMDVTGGTGAQTDSYTTPATVPADNRALFHCVVTNAGGNTSSNAATLAVIVPPTITTEPADTTVVEGSRATFTVVAAGGALSYQWQKNGVNVTGGTGAASDTYTTPATVIATDNGAQFTCVVTNIAGSLTSNAATLTVQPFVSWKVDAGVAASGDGRTWAAAFKTLQEALDVATTGEEIWVAAGTYYPTTGTARGETFQLLDGVAIYGGFDGTETLRGQRDWEVNVTTLSGDIGVSGDDSDNAYHVVTGADNATLDGFTVTAGNAGYSPSVTRGGGMYNYSSSPTVTNCVFSANSADEGGGMWNSSLPTLTNCMFSGNSASRGGGMWNASSPTLTNCTFSGNSASLRGGGMYNDNSHSSPTLTNCTFSSNSADGNGGGMYNYFDASPTLTGCTFSGNWADDGGGIYNWHGASPTVTNCTFSGNSASYYYGGGIYNGGFSTGVVTDCVFSGNFSATLGGGMHNSGSSSPTVMNCTFSANSADSSGGGMSNSSSLPTVTNCTFLGNSAGTRGGGMWNSSSSPTATNCTFSGNSAGTWGGGMYNAFSSPTLANCALSGNSAGYDGGGMHNSSSSPTLVNCTFSGNSAGYDGGGMDNYGISLPTLLNCVLWGNAATTSGPEVHNFDADSTPTFSHCDIEGSGGSGASWNTSLGADGGNNIADNPLFMDPDGADNIVGTVDDDLRLTAGSSPCIDAGDTTALPADTADLDGDTNTTEDIPHDLDGSPRVVGSEVDMGAYEVQ